jgi:hypothetical protein
MGNRIVLHATLLLAILCFPAIIFAQPKPNPCLPPNVAEGQRRLTDYIEQRICENLKARVVQTDPTKQSAPPAAAANSTSLVERSSAPDLLGLGLDFLNLSDVAGGKKSATPKTLTFSAYALKSALSSEDPLDPEIYNKNAKWRSVSFTVGYDVPENTNTREPIVGIKWLAYNGRDVGTSANQTEIGKIQAALDNSAIGFSKIRGDVRLYLFALLQKRAQLPAGVTITTLTDFNDNVVSDPTKFESILKALSDDEKKNIDAIVAKNISAFATLDADTKNAVKTIRTRPQLALAFTTTQRNGKRPDEYSGVLTFDKGMGTNSITMNGSFIFKKSPTGKDSKGGQFAAAVHLPLQAFKPLGYTDPVLFSLEANATGMTGVAPVYKAQAKLTIPLMPGVEIPISVSVANRTEFIKEKEVKGKFGFTFDISKALKAFRDGFQKRE